ncbi:MAG: hypothetical protein NVS3B14_23460 [Ktedonobacteraceae bacterium]
MRKTSYRILATQTLLIGKLNDYKTATHDWDQSGSRASVLAGIPIISMVHMFTYDIQIILTCELQYLFILEK